LSVRLGVVHGFAGSDPALVRAHLQSYLGRHLGSLIRRAIRPQVCDA
jgi:hypothetical protein